MTSVLHPLTGAYTGFQDAMVRRASLREGYVDLQLARTFGGAWCSGVAFRATCVALDDHVLSVVDHGCARMEPPAHEELQ